LPCIWKYRENNRSLNHLSPRFEVCHHLNIFFDCINFIACAVRAKLRRQLAPRLTFMVLNSSFLVWFCYCITKEKDAFLPRLKSKVSGVRRTL
jgi:hypothetical protein